MTQSPESQGPETHWIERYAQFLFRFRWLVLLIMLALTAGGLYGAKNLTFKGDYRIFFSEDNPQLAAHDALERTYTKADSIIFVVQLDEDTIYQRDVLEAVQWISEEGWQLPLAIRVDSITNFQHLFVSGDDIVVRDLVDNPQELSPSELDYVEKVAESEPFIAGKAVALDERTTAVQVTFQLPDNPAQIAGEIAETARDIRERALERFPGLTIKVTGTVMLNNAFSEVAIKDMTTLYPLMLAFLALTMFWFLRSAWGALNAMIVVLLSATVAYGIAGWLGFYISSPSTSAFVIILTVAVADSIHVMVTMFKQMRDGAQKRKAISESLRINMQPVFLTSLTTAIGFFSLNFSDAPPIKDLGNISAFGAIAAFFYSIILLPVLLGLLPMKAHATGGRDKKVLSAIVEFVIRRKIAIVSAFVILLVVVGFAMPRLYINDKFVEFFSRDMDFRTATDFSMENLTGIYVVEFSLGAGEPGGIADPEYLERVDEFVSWIESYPP
ncbi:MAG: MMPL family transporter, partial [Alphaproteobacteria bacterium]|nr:MMPL family transporter [Alphaproteobacteria bacterium]